MKSIEINIGLNNNPMSYCDVKNLLSEKYGANVQQQVGEYNGDIEPTAVAVFDIPDDYNIVQAIEKICIEMTQQCIAVKVDGEGFLVYEPSWEGERYDFSDEYFLSFIDAYFEDVSKSTRSGFYHKSSLYINGRLVSEARVSYYNRTWESYEFETSRRAAFDKAQKLPKKLKLTANELFAVKQLIERS